MVENCIPYKKWLNFRQILIRQNVKLSLFQTQNKISKFQKQILSTILMVIILVYREQFRFAISGYNGGENDPIYLALRLVWKLLTSNFQEQEYNMDCYPKPYRIKIYGQNPPETTREFDIGDPCALYEGFFTQKIGPINDQNTQVEEIFISSVHEIRAQLTYLQYLLDDFPGKFSRKSLPLVPIENNQLGTYTSQAHFHTQYDFRTNFRQFWDGKEFGAAQIYSAGLKEFSIVKDVILDMSCPTSLIETNGINLRDLRAQWQADKSLIPISTEWTQNVAIDR